MRKNSKLNILPYTLVNGYIGFIIGAITGILYSVGGFAIDTLVTLNIITSMDTPGLSIGTLYAFGALIVMPLLAALCGLSFGIIGGTLYNVSSKFLPFKISTLN